MKALFSILLLTASIRVLGEPAVPPGRQVEVEVQFVAFDSAEVEKLAIKQAVNVDSLTALWADGSGRLIACPRVLTRSGTEATVRGVSELIYPTAFVDSVSPDSASNGTCAVSVIAPRDFETREEGAILSVVPEISDDGNIINLNLRPEWVQRKEWQDYGLEIPSTNAAQRKTPMLQPVFYRLAVESQVSLVPGRRVLLGGGAPGKDPGTLVFTFVTCRLVEADGKPVPAPESTIPEQKAPEAKKP